jgi:ABC-2 type transport system ATP-binding protein
LGGAYRIQIEAEGSLSKVREALQSLPGVGAVNHANGRYEIESQNDLRAAAASAVIQAGGRLKGLNIESQSLDDIYTRYFEEVKHGSAS